MQLKPYRKIILIIEFVALVVLLGSMFTFAQLSDGKPLDPRLWLIPIAASFFVISGFAANLYIRWIENPDTQSATHVQRLFIYLVIFSLYAVWITAVGQAWNLQNIVSSVN